MKRFKSFCTLYNILTPFPVSESILCYFASYLAGEKLSPQSIKIYLAGVRNMQIKLGLPEPREYSSLARLKLLQGGIQRTHSERVEAKERIRLPVTPAILGQLKKHWLQQDKGAEGVMLWAAATICFHGFFRAGEITIPTASSFDPQKHLAWGDIAVDDPLKPDSIRIHLKRSKTDQLGVGVDVFIGRSGNSICPIEAFVNYVAVRGSDAGCFFLLDGKRPLTKPVFVKRVREALQAIGMPCDSFAGHSFRIGAATAAARAGLEDSVIRVLGRWNSSAFLSYIRTPREQLAQYSKSLSA